MTDEENVDMEERSVPQPTETGWYAGPWPDEVYYLSDEGKWGTSFARPEDTSHIAKRKLFTEDPRIARIKTLSDDIALGVAYSMGQAEVPSWVEDIRAILRGEA